MSQTLCLSFLILQSVAAPPKHVQELLLSRLHQQWSSHKPEITLEIAKSKTECANEGELRLEESAFVFQADHLHWRGVKTISYSNLLDGKKIDFEQVSPSSLSAPRNSHQAKLGRRTFSEDNKDSKSKFKKWLPWVLAAVGIGTSAYLIHDRNQHIKKMQGLSIKF